MIKCAWNPHAAYVLRGALGDALADVAAEVDEGRAELWRYPPATYLVTRIECSPKGRELVLVALAGEAGHTIGRQWLAIAAGAACQSVRVHSRRPGMGRYLAPLGFQPVETVYQARVN